MGGNHSAVQSSPIKATQVATSGIVQNLSQVEQFPIEEPVHVKAPSVGIDISVSDPSSTEVSTLDSALLKGAVRYPNSALLGQNAAVYLFGHQSYLPIVHNQAFKAFNGLQKLKAGDEVIVSSQSADYHYRVTSVRLVEASEATIDLSSGARKLILTTCDSFGTKTQRYVVEADFISRNPVTQK
ncbi:sortase [Candidatus Kaiserbacteria bacterium]|nr:sortase [Candidatus Kaiserbacteria bacterium]